MKKLLHLLIDCASPDFSGKCWGYNFIWANPVKILPKYYPSLVVTSFIVKGIYEYYLATKDPMALEIIKSSARYIENDIPITENKYGICFSYSDIMKDCCFNASMLGAEVMAIMYSITNKNFYYIKSRKAVDFVLAYQKRDGRWNYSIDLKTNKEEEQIDFHQGFILESLRNILELTKMTDTKYLNALSNGTKFYYNYQTINGKILKYRLPKKYPIDIHNQAQAIITFAKLTDQDSKYLSYSEDILIWTIKNMQDPQSGYFYYRIGKLFKNKISYMRWSQAWMCLALSTYLKNIK